MAPSLERRSPREFRSPNRCRRAESPALLFSCCDCVPSEAGQPSLLWMGWKAVSPRLSATHSTMARAAAPFGSLMAASFCAMSGALGSISSSCR